MTYHTTISRRSKARIVAVLVGAILISAVQAQVAQSPGTSPDKGNCSPAQPLPPQAVPPKTHRFREFFASTLAAVVQTATGGIVGTLNGRIMDWFGKKGYREGYSNPGMYPAQVDPTQSTAAVDPYGVAETNESQPCDYPAAEQVYDARTGQLIANGDIPYIAAASGYDDTLYAGIAYEVHALAADGNSTSINAATYEFHTGDKFLVYFRPSLPGRLEVYNINPAGQQTLIEPKDIAAGQLTRLGPYQFTGLTGDELLRLVLTPCSNPLLLATTRDIVLADAGPETTSQMAEQPSGGFQLPSCDAPTTRGLDVRTRDIEKVAVDDLTTFALDPVSQQEYDSGQVTPREVTIVFHSI